MLKHVTDGPGPVVSDGMGSRFISLLAAALVALPLAAAIPAAAASSAEASGLGMTSPGVRGATAPFTADSDAGGADGDPVEQLRGYVPDDPDFLGNAADNAASQGSTSADESGTSAATRAGAPAATALPGPLATGSALISGPRPNPAMDKVLRHTGLGFDTCYSPTLDTMRTWRKHSPYEVIGIYIGGNSATCLAHSEENLTKDWVDQVHAMGWRTIPTFVGYQAECATYNKNGQRQKFPHRMSNNAKVAATQGKDEGKKAVALMKVRGLGPNNPIYLDMEAWDTKNAKCTDAVFAFTDAWNREVRKAGYVTGFYSSAASGINAIVTYTQASQSFMAPDALWFARWDDKGSSARDVGSRQYLPDNVWADQERIKQFKGGHKETYGGVTINIDSNFVDGPVTGTVIGLNPASLPTINARKNTSIQLKGSGGVKPYIFGKLEGALPQGLTMSRSGKITGKATDPGKETTIRIVVKDDGDPRRAGTRTYTVYTTYSDVPTSHQFFNTVKWLALNRITYGYSDGSFRPTGAVTRGQMAAFMFRLVGEGKAPKCDVKQFSDINSKSLFCQHITWMASTGITSGYADGSFRDNVPVTRGQMAAFLFRTLNPGKAPAKCNADGAFKDVGADNKFCGHIAWLADTGITVGYSDGTFRPDASVTRGAMSAFLQRLSNRL